MPTFPLLRCKITRQTGGNFGLGVVNPQARSLVEMLYQSTNDYLFSDEKFRARFPRFQQQHFADLLASTVKYFADKHA